MPSQDTACHLNDTSTWLVAFVVTDIAGQSPVNNLLQREAYPHCAIYSKRIPECDSYGLDAPEQSRMDQRRPSILPMPSLQVAYKMRRAFYSVVSRST